MSLTLFSLAADLPKSLSVNVIHLIKIILVSAFFFGCTKDQAFQSGSMSNIQSSFAAPSTNQCSVGQVWNGTACVTQVCNPAAPATSIGCPSIVNGSSQRQCNALGTAFGSCNSTCNTNYSSSGTSPNITCTLNPCTNGGTNPPMCNNCNSGFYYDGSQCRANICTPGAAATPNGCPSIQNGSSTRVCNSVGSAYETCVSNCNENFAASGTQPNITCTATSCQNGAINSACTICPDTHYMDTSNMCRPKVCTVGMPATSTGCPNIPNGGSTRTCNSNGSAYNTCQSTCNTDYNVTGTQPNITCVPKPCTNGAQTAPSCTDCLSTHYYDSTSQACVVKVCEPTAPPTTTGCPAIPNGSSTRTCNNLGSVYNTCTSTCNNYFTMSGTQPNITCSSVTPTFAWSSNLPNSSIYYASAQTLNYSVSPSENVTVTCKVNSVAQACSSSQIVISTQGDSSVVVEAVHASGGSVTSSAVMVHIDMVSPTVTVVSQPAAITQSNEYTFKISATNSGERLSYVRAIFDGSAEYTVSNPVFSNNEGTVEFGGTTTYGTHNISIRVADLAGNLSQPITYQWQVQPAGVSVAEELPLNDLTINGLFPYPGKWTTPAVVGNGHTFTWDNRVFIATQGNPGISTYSQFGYWAASVLRPEINAPGPESFGSMFSTPKWIMAPEAGYSKVSSGQRSNMMNEFNALAVAPYYTNRAYVLDLYKYVFERDPRDSGDSGLNFWTGELDSNRMTRKQVADVFYGSMERKVVRGAEDIPASARNSFALPLEHNPYPSNAEGLYDETGAYETYDMLIYTQAYNFEILEFQKTPLVQSLPLNNAHLGVMRARMVISNPKTPEADISKFILVEDFALIRDQNGNFINNCIEPTVTADGMMLVYQVFPGSFMNYTYNEYPEKINNWAVPAPISSMYTKEASTTVEGMNFKKRYPLAANPIRDSLGQVIPAGTFINGAYPWMSWEGTELFFQSQTGPGGAMRNGPVVLGRMTGNQIRLLDGTMDVNPDRATPGNTLLFMSGIGATSSIWNPFKKVNKSNFPYLPNRPVMMMVGSNDNSYFEVDFTDFVDGRYVMAWPMSAALMMPTNQITMDTPDLSGNYLYGTAEGFSFQRAIDAQLGYVGQGAAMKGADKITSRTGPALSKLTSVTVETFIKIDRANIVSEVPIVTRADLFKLSLSSDRRLNASVFVRTAAGQNETYRVQAMGPSLASNTWYHLAMSYNEATGDMRLYLNGRLFHETNFLAAPVVTDTVTPVVLGARWGGDNLPLYTLDEFKLSSIERSATEIANSAKVPNRFRNSFNLTQFLNQTLRFDVKDIGLDEQTSLSQEKAQLGFFLFTDKLLSQNQTVSCQSCHKVENNMTDGLARSPGFNGQLTPRRSPSSFNRLFSNTQMWDGKFTSMHMQALGPILNPVEMGLTADELVNRVSDNRHYNYAFRRLYQSPPNVSNIRAALAAFFASMTATNAPVDLFESGNLSVLTPEQKFGRELFYGKARCAACHSGPNYSDEQLHNTGLLTDTDLGKKTLTEREFDHRSFKTPTLRNIGPTGVFLHNGAMTNLDVILTAYNAGGIGDATNLSPEIRPLSLRQTEKTALKAFIESFKSTDGVKPLFSTLKLNATSVSQYYAVPPNFDPSACFEMGQFKRFNLSRKDTIKYAYCAFLGRQPDSGGLAYYMPQGLSRFELFTSMMQSDELSGIILGKKQIDLSTEEFIRVLYRGAFKREPDSSYYSDAINSGTATRNSVMRSFYDSPEFRQKHNGF